MKEWMTIKDLSEYLQASESMIRSFIRQKRIPFYDNHGLLRFNKAEIDEWMKTPEAENNHDISGEGEFIYRGRSIKDYKLTASLVLIGAKPWERLPEFVKKTVKALNDIERDYLYHEEFESFLDNYNDYLRISCQLGLIENRKEDDRKKHYYPTEYAKKIFAAENIGQIKQIILNSILNIIEKNLETKPDERHTILLLWYILSIKDKDRGPDEYYFRLMKDKAGNNYPSIRFGFINSFCEYLFEGDRKKEQEFFDAWCKLIKEQG